MDTHDRPGLFDIPEGPAPDPPQRTRRANNRQAWTRAATAEVTIIDPDALQAAAARAETGAVTIGLDLDTSAEEEDTSAGVADESAFGAALRRVRSD